MNKRFIILAVLVVALVLGFATQAMAATSDDIIITARVNSKMTVIAPADHYFGALDPDTTGVAPYVADVTVQSNTGYTLSRTEDALAPAGMFTIPEAVDGTYLKALAPAHYTQSYSLNLQPAGDWLDPGLYSKTFTYSIVP